LAYYITVKITLVLIIILLYIFIVQCNDECIACYINQTSLAFLSEAAIRMGKPKLEKAEFSNNTGTTIVVVANAY